ncbi:MAG: hypothetical protein IJ569_02660 [Prevotella sp.]|nr:hypothetical protein [Prevotella sp.]
MDDITRYLTYYDRPSIDDFDIDVSDTYDAAFYTALFGVKDADSTLLNERTLCEVFNDAHYIVTLCLLDSHPERELALYCKIAMGNTVMMPKHTEEELNLRMSVVMGMVVAILESFRFQGYDTDTERLLLHIGTWVQKDDKRKSVVEYMKNAVDNNRYNHLRSPSPNDFSPLPLNPAIIDTITWEKELTLECDENGPWEVSEHEAEWLVRDVARGDEMRKRQFVDLLIDYFEKVSRTEKGLYQADNYKAYLRKFYALKRELAPKTIIDDLAKNIDWVKLTNDFNLGKIKDVVETVGRNNHERKIIIKAIYDAESATGNMYKIPYSVDKLLNDLYKKYDENQKDLWEAAYNESSETLNLDMLMKHAIDDYMEHHMATDEDIDEIFNDNHNDIDNRIEDEDPLLQQIAELKAEVNGLLKENADLKERLHSSSFEIDRLREENAKLEKSQNPPQIVLTNNSNFARVVQAMVSARYFKRADGDETNATEVGGMLLKMFGVSNTWKSVLQKAYSRENPLKTFDELRDVAQKYWTNRSGLTKDIRKKGKK